MSLPALVADHRPRPRDRQVLNVAHRGASCSAPENTLAAVHRAADQGADVVEVDVRRSRDGVPVLLHDVSLARTTDAASLFPDRAPWAVEDFDHDELLCLDAGSWFSPAFVSQRLPTLDEVMETARLRGLGLLVELKAPGAHPDFLTDVTAVVRRQLARGGSAPRVVVQSFDHEAMRRLKSSLPSVPVGLLGAPSAAALAAAAEWADQVNPHHLTVDAGYINAIQAQGMRCHLWTVNSRRAMRRALRLEVDGIITDRPQVLGELVRELSDA